MLNIIIFGAPGSGKGTQSELMEKNYNLAHISTGDVLRQEIKNETALGKTAKQYIDKGELVPDDLICDMLDQVLETQKDAAGVIFDGFPRTIPQAEALEKILAKRGWEVSVLVDLQVEDRILIDRLLERGKISGRSDDNEETIQSRLNVYHSQTAPLADYYKQKGKHVAINGVGEIEEIFHRIDREISNKRKTLKP
ncbi:MAG: adenylate kinase [Tannerella sp.]|jgi:adenylate kinase|nr:adenylate kinase [Tannerella sp.]